MFQLAFNAPDGVQGGSMIPIETLSNGLQGLICVPPGKINGHLPRFEDTLLS